MDRQMAPTGHHETCTFFFLFSPCHILLNPLAFAFRRSMHQCCYLWRLVNHIVLPKRKHVYQTAS